MRSEFNIMSKEELLRQVESLKEKQKEENELIEKLQKQIEDIARVKAIICYKIFTVDKEEAKSRIHSDLAVGKDRSAVPDEIVDKMYSNFDNAVIRVKAESAFSNIYIVREKGR